MSKPRARRGDREGPCRACGRATRFLASRAACGNYICGPCEAERMRRYRAGERKRRPPGKGKVGRPPGSAARESAVTPPPEVDPTRQTRIDGYAARAAAGLPLFGKRARR